MGNNKSFNNSEPDKSWGGEWTEKKLDAFAKYVSAYLTIMKRNPYWQTIYFDGFAGSGIRKPNCNKPLYKELMLSDEDEKLYKGAAERVLNLPDDLFFNYYYFIDTKEGSLDKLQVKLSAFLENEKYKLVFRSDDCNKQICELATAMKTNKNSYASLLFLDPFGMQINWESIESLRDTRSDIWILVPTGVIVNRLLDKSGRLMHIEKLVKFFGLSEAEIKEIFYFTSTLNTLFGQEEIIQKISKPIEKIADLYAQRLKSIWKYVTDKPLCLKNSRGVPIFHFVFASNNNNALKIANQIIKTT